MNQEINESTRVPLYWFFLAAGTVFGAAMWLTTLQIRTEENSRRIEEVRVQQDQQIRMLQEIRETLAEIKVQLRGDTRGSLKRTGD